MSRRRYISTEISFDAQVNKLAMASDFAGLLYTWLIPHAEDDGQLTGTPEEILYKVLPGRRDKHPSDIEAALTLMERLSLIEWDQDLAVVAFPEEAFYRYQTYIKPERRRSPRQPPPSPPDNNRKRGSENFAESPETSGQDLASVSHSFKPSSSFSHSHSHSAAATIQTAHEGGGGDQEDFEAQAKTVAEMGGFLPTPAFISEMAETLRDFPDLEGANEMEGALAYCDHQRIEMAWPPAFLRRWMAHSRQRIRSCPPRASPPVVKPKLVPPQFRAKGAS